MREPFENYPHAVILRNLQGMNLSEFVKPVASTGLTDNFVSYMDYECKPEIAQWLSKNVPPGGYRRRKTRQPPDYEPALEVRFKEVRHAVLFKLRWF